MKFIDVSSNNNFARISDSYSIIARGLDGVIIKATQGTSYRNPYMSTDWANFRTFVANIAFYHYVENCSAEEIDYFYNNIVGKSYSFVMVDIEDAAIDTLANSAAMFDALNTHFPNNYCVYISQAYLAELRKYYNGPVIVADWENENAADALAQNEGAIGVQWTDALIIMRVPFDGYDIFSIPEKASDTVSNTSTDVIDNIGATPANETVTGDVPSGGATELVTEFVKWTADENGDAWVEVSIDVNHIVSVILQGPYPPTDGYWKTPKVSMQERSEGAGKTCITFIECNPNSEFSFWLKYFK